MARFKSHGVLVQLKKALEVRDVQALDDAIYAAQPGNTGTSPPALVYHSRSSLRGGEGGDRRFGKHDSGGEMSVSR